MSVSAATAPPPQLPAEQLPRPGTAERGEHADKAFDSDPGQCRGYTWTRWASITLLSPRQNRVGLAAIGIFATAFAVRLMHVWQMRATPFFSVLMGDSRGYDEWARRIAGGEWIGHEVFYQAPLYPYLLGLLYAIFGRHLLLVRVMQAAIGSASCVLLAMAAARLFSRRVGVVAGLMLALYAPAVFFDGLVQKSVLDVFFVCAALYFIAAIIDRQRAGPAAVAGGAAHTSQPSPAALWLALGATMGALALTRENALALIVVVVVWALFSGQTLRTRTRTRTGTGTSTIRTRTKNPEPRTLNLEPRSVLLLLTGLAVVLAPVAARNAYVGGGFYITTSQAGPNFYIGNNPNADGTYQSLRFGRGAPEYERQDATELAERALGRTLTPGEVSTYWIDKALDFVISRPGAWLRLIGRKAALLVNATEVLDTESQEAHAEYSLPLRVLGVIGHFGVLVPLAVLGAVLTWPMRRRLWILYALTGVYAASVVAFYVFARYRYPLVPMLILFAAGGLVYGVAWFTAAPRDPSRAESGWTAAAVAAAAIVCNWPIGSTTLMRAVTQTNLAVALQADGRLEEATSHYQRAIALRPDYAPAYNNLGTAYRAEHRLGDAVAAYERAIALRSGDFAEAHYNLANALADEGNPAQAAEHFRVALQTISGSADVHNNLGIALVAEGKSDEAIAEFRAAVAADPAAAKAHRNLADALGSTHRTDEAIAEFRRAVALAPGDGAIRYDLGSLLLELDRPEEAIQEFRISLTLNPRSPQTHNNLGIALATQGRIDQAAQEFRAALAIDPHFEDARRNLQMAAEAKKPSRVQGEK